MLRKENREENERKEEKKMNFFLIWLSMENPKEKDKEIFFNVVNYIKLLIFIKLKKILVHFINFLCLVIPSFVC